MLSVAECERAAREALDSLPGGLAQRMEAVAVIVEESHPEGLMGIYDPVDGIERIVIFREANESVDDVRTTVFHEVGHYFGMDEGQLEGLGYG